MTQMSSLRLNTKYCYSDYDQKSFIVHCIKYVVSYKDLGVLIDSQLTFKKHITLVKSQQGLLNVGDFKENFKKCFLLMFLNICTTMVRTLLEYANTIWLSGPTEGL